MVLGRIRGGVLFPVILNSLDLSFLILEQSLPQMITDQHNLQKSHKSIKEVKKQIFLQRDREILSEIEGERGTDRGEKERNGGGGGERGKDRNCECEY